MVSYNIENLVMEDHHHSTRSHDSDHHVSIREPSAEELKELENSHDDFESTPTGIICSICGKNESHYESHPCRCCTFCKKCAMRVATGGKCKKCHNMFTSITQMHHSNSEMEEPENNAEN